MSWNIGQARRRLHKSVLAIAFCLSYFDFAFSQNARIDARELAKRIAAEYSAALQYAYAGRIVITRAVVPNPKVVLANAKVNLAVAPVSKYRLTVEEGPKIAYTLVSDGRKRWMYVPSMKKYTEKDEMSAAEDDNAIDSDNPQLLPRPELISSICRRIIPIVSAIGDGADAVFMSGSALAVLTKKSDRDTQDTLYLSVDPVALKLRRVTWMHGTHVSREEKALLRVDLDLYDFQLGALAQGTEFTFNPPEKTRRVEVLQLPRVKPGISR